MYQWKCVSAWHICTGRQIYDVMSELVVSAYLYKCKQAWVYKKNILTGLLVEQTGTKSKINKFRDFAHKKTK